MKRLVFAALLLAGSAQARITCADVRYGAGSYDEKMQELMKVASIDKTGYYNRYVESYVSDVCKKGASADDETYVDQGYLKHSQAWSIKEILGFDGRSVAGRRYEQALSRLEDAPNGDMSYFFSHAESTNLAYHYGYKPSSPCAKLVSRVLKKDKEAVSALRGDNRFAYCARGD